MIPIRNSFLAGALFSLATLALLAVTPGEARAQGTKPPEITFTIHKLLEENVEGPDVERTYFLAGDKRVVFGVPLGCRLSPEGGHLHISIADTGLDGEIHVDRSPFTAEFDLAKEVLTYRETASKGMPNGATNVEVQQPIMNPFPFNGWKSLGFTWSYSAAGRGMVRTVSYINLEFGTQIVVTTLSTKKDAEQVSKLARQFMGSWWTKGK